MSKLLVTLVNIYRSLLISTITLLCLGCGSDSSNDQSLYKLSSGNRIYFPSKGPVSVTKSIDRSLDSLSAEEGGVGFEFIASERGWITSTNFYRAGDSRAVKGGVFRRGFTELPETLRAYGLNATNTINQRITSLVYEKLLNEDEVNGEFYPSLATHWKFNNDSSGIYFRIDPEAKWSDGNSVSVEDVEATINLIRSPGIKDGLRGKIIERFRSIETISPLIFFVEFDKGGIEVVRNFATLRILPEHQISRYTPEKYLDRFNFNMMIGSGPYIIDNQSSRKWEFIELRRRIDYWGQYKKRNKGLNNFDALHFYFYKDLHELKNSFIEDHLDIYEISGDDEWYNQFYFKRSNLKVSNKLKHGVIQTREVINKFPPIFTGITFNCDKKPFNDLNIRKAFAYLLNRERIVVESLDQSHYLTDSFYPKRNFRYRSKKPIRYNPRKAEQYLIDAGYNSFNKDGYRVNSSGEVLEVEFTCVERRFFDDYSDDLERLGIKLNVVSYPIEQLNKKIDNRDFQMTYMAYIVDDIYSPMEILHSKYANLTHTANITNFKNSSLDSLVEKLERSKSIENSKSIITSIDSLLQDQIPYFLTFHKIYTNRIAYWNRFGMPKSIFSYNGTHTTIHNLWWYDSKMEKEMRKGIEDSDYYLGIGERVVDYWRLSQ